MLLLVTACLDIITENTEAATAAALGDCTDYFPKQVELQYADKGIDIVVFGHTHYPLVKKFDNGITTINDGTWIDRNTSYPGGLSRTFTVISTGKKTTAAVYTYEIDGKIKNVTKTISLKHQIKTHPTIMGSCLSIHK